MPSWLIKGLIIAALAGLACWGMIKIRDGWVETGYTQCTTDVAAAKFKADAIARTNQAEIRKDTQKRKEKIYEEDDDRPVGKLLLRYFDSLRNTD